MSTTDDGMTDLPQLKRLYRYLLGQGQAEYAAEVDEAFREIRGLREEAEWRRADGERIDWLEDRYPGVIDLVDDREDHDTLREAIDHMMAGGTS